MFGEELLLNWLKERGFYGYATIVIIIFLLVIWSVVYGSAIFIASLDTINEHLNPSENNTGYKAIHLVDNEIPAGIAPNLTLAYAPNPAKSLQLYMNGMFLKAGVDNDYILTGKSITILYPGVSREDQFIAYYRY